MGTNYYARKDCCKTCGRSDTELHIGKSSGGWTFSFRGYRESVYETFDGEPITTWKKWQEVLQDPTVDIFDEYGEQIPLSALSLLVEQKKAQQRNHTTYVRNDSRFMGHADSVWLDDEGNSFSEGEFS